MYFKSRYVVGVVSTTADAALKMASDTGSFIEHRSQTISPCQGVSWLPLVLEQLEASLLDL
jgi:hypothetical protein